MESVASVTAETMALQRSFESHGARRRRLFTDPFADDFLRPSWRALATASGVPILRRLAVGVYDSVGGRGPRPSAVVRTKIIDDAVNAAVPGHDQCVLLGAGYDTRAHRLTAMSGRRVFELDHPATQEVKRSVIERLGIDTHNITYVAVDFERDDLARRLVERGFDPESPAVFVWEGVSQYLTKEAVDSTLDVVRRMAGHGGVLIATYVDRRALTEPSPFPEARRWIRAVARVGEPWIFGLLPEEASGFFAARGFVLQRDVSTLDASRDWLSDRSPRHWGSELYRVAIARAEPSAA
ncbi:MAG TPA: SAM-dependent methyltransferase [Acidimicrobiales bacterium]|nr:SAM-dependent methyltransferase [Acidimicrobiales bacterium]